MSTTPGATTQYVIYNTTGGTGVTWSVNGVVGGNANVGTITAAGAYTAPATVPMANVVTVKATSVPSGIYGTSAVTIQQPTPNLWSTSPTSFNTGSNQKISLNGGNYTPLSTVQVGGVMWTTTYVSATALTATGNLLTAGTFAVTVTNPGNGATTSAPVNITVKVAPVSVAVSPSSATVTLAATAQFTATVIGTSNAGVTWTATAGSISSTGLFTAPAAMPSSSTVTVTATSMADTTKSGKATVTLQSASRSGGSSGGGSSGSSGSNGSGGGGIVTGSGTPGNNTANLHAGRFLEQAAFGPSPADLAYIQQNTSASVDGINVWLANQFGMQGSTIALPISTSNVASDTLHRMATAPDQLRQKMAWALGQFIVISMNKNIYPDQYVPYQAILANDAFGNFRTLLYDITVSPQMGQYLDLANSNKAGVGSGANENYAREVMQLFTIGLTMLNIDGANQLDASGSPIPTYLQPDIVHHAAALTGWTYPTAPGATPQPNNQPYFDSPTPVMETRPGNHDASAKTLIKGCNPLPANQTVLQDTNAVLDCLFYHPNVGPFVATRLIQNLVTSNPTPGYVQRIATVFNNNGQGVRGDLKAVLTAILTDPEARQDTVRLDASGNPYYMLNGTAVSYNPGRLKDPIYLIVSFVRAMNGTIPVGTIIPWNFVAMGEQVNQPQSVFGYWSPLYHLPFKQSLLGPEYQIYTPTESVEEANMLQTIITMPTSDPSIDLSGFNAAVLNTPALLDLADQRFFYGRMPAALRSALAVAIDANTDNPSRVFTAVYLAALAGQYQTQF
jgi:uncharacterized protein (DUF1800 family)